MAFEAGHLLVFLTEHGQSISYPDTDSPAGHLTPHLRLRLRQISGRDPRPRSPPREDAMAVLHLLNVATITWLPWERVSCWGFSFYASFRRPTECDMSCEQFDPSPRLQWSCCPAHRAIGSLEFGW